MTPFLPSRERRSRRDVQANGEVEFLFQVLRDMLATLFARRESGAGGAVLRMSRPGAYPALAIVESVLVLALALSTLSLSGVAPGGAIPVPREPKRAELARHFSPLELTRISMGMSRYAALTADRIGRGAQGWTPTGVIGWGVYDLTPPALVRHQLTYDEARAFNALIPVSPAKIAPMTAFSLKVGTDDYTRALECLTQAIYYEAGYESGEGEEAVAQVILNRLKHPAYPKTVCGVVYQGSSLTTGCQFSFTCDGSLARAPNEAAWLRCRQVAAQALSGFVYAPVGTATHYHADYVFPYWAITLVKLKQIGAHIFYRMTGPPGSLSGFTGQYAGNEAILSSAILTGGDARTPDAPSAIVSAPEARPPEPKLVTLTIGGETRTYAISPTAAPPPLPDTVAVDLGDRGRVTPPVGAVVTGTIMPSRRMPTPEEIRDINEKIRQRQMQQAGVVTAPPTTTAP